MKTQMKSSADKFSIQKSELEELLKIVGGYEVGAMFHCSVFCAELLCTKFLQKSPLDIQQNQSKRPTH